MDDNDQKQEELYLELYDSCRKGDYQMVEFYLQSGLQANWSNKRDRNRSLLMATASKDSEGACMVLLKAKVSVNHTDTAKMTALHICAKQNAFKVARLLLECNGVDPNALADNNITPLMICADLGHLETGRLLLASDKIDLNIQSSRGFTALMKAVFENTKDLALEMIKKPGLKLDLATNGGFTVLHLCAQLGRQELAEQIIGKLSKEELKKLIDRPTSQEFKCNSALILAALNGHVRMVETLLENGADVNYKNMDGATALDQVNRLGGPSDEIINCLEKRKLTYKKETFESLRDAISNEATNLSKVKELLNEIQFTNQISKDNQASSLLLLAAALGNDDVLRLLIEKIGDNAAVNWTVGKDNATPLHAAIQSGSDKCIELLLDRGADVSHTNELGFNALHLCAEVNAPKITVERLLRKASDSDVQAKDNFKRTPVEVAAVRGSVAALRQLLEREKKDGRLTLSDQSTLNKILKLAEDAKQHEAADVLLEFIPKVADKDKDKEEQQRLVNKLFKASMERKKDEVEKLLKDPIVLKLGKKLLNAKSQRETKWTALMAAAWNDDVDICEILLREGADPNVADEGLGITALHIAVQQNSKRVVEKLLERGCNVDAQSIDKRTPLIRAAWLSHRDIGKLLLDKGADVNAQEFDGFSALHFCAQENLFDFAKLLIRYEANLELTTHATKYSNTAFTLAAIKGHVEMLDLLANVGANIYHAGEKGNALELAMKSQRSDAAKRLMELDKERHCNWQPKLSVPATERGPSVSASTDTICTDKPHLSNVSRIPSFEEIDPLNRSTLAILGTEYSMTANPRGICVIINNNEFIKGIDQRHGSLQDEEALTTLFRDKLKFRVHVHRNLDAMDIKAVMLTAANKDRHARCDCFVAFIMSHGENGKVYGSDGELVNLTEIFTPFCKCTSLEGKPKLFFVQACRKAGEINVDAPAAPTQPLVTLPTSEADSRGFSNALDFLYAYATIEGDFALRDTREGSIYVQTLCRVFTESYNKMHLSDMLMAVRQRMGCERYRLPLQSNPVFNISSEVNQLQRNVWFRGVNGGTDLRENQ